ncbi:hypothetical protein SELMODRAFT_438756 [Selaginella moellendorffii]|uniref:Uncharacterized protein n=1 Tax=Selaginella moellendorffii TaxID=88036 RepID=D8QZ63_SELML|nr:hypothetical protein SELMODRAFT_438756 [Selaginella moellendorffii]
MAVQVSNILNAPLKHPLISSGLLLLFVLPIFFQVLVYFVPLFLSTALCVAALVTLGPSFQDGEHTPPQKDDKSWLGRIRCLQESARVWCESKLKIAESNTEELPEEECLDSPIVKTEHEKRVHQLERTLRSLSFVSYEGIFASDGSLIDMDDSSFNNDGDDAPKAAENDAQRAENQTHTEEHEINDPPTDREASENQEETLPEDSTSWQQVEHPEAQKV